jgi:hypothetical protein
MDYTTRRKRAAMQAERVHQAGKDAYQKCIIFDCQNLTRAATRNGLGELYCRKHADHYQEAWQLPQQQLYGLTVSPIQTSGSQVDKEEPGQPPSH